MAGEWIMQEDMNRTVNTSPNVAESVNAILLLGVALVWATSISGNAATVWDFEGTGNYLRAPQGATNLSNQAQFSFKAQVSSDGRYRVETSYQNLHDILVYDGTNTVAHRGVNQPSGQPLGADVVVLSGAFPENLVGNVQAVWLATCLNVRIATTISPNAFDGLFKSKYLRDNYGDEVARQMVIRTNAAPGKLLVGVYLPGDAKKEGKRMFVSEAYKNGLMFQRLEYSERDMNTGFYSAFAFSNCLPYRDPESPEDVLPFETFDIRLERFKIAQALNTELPQITSLVGVSDYSTPGNTNALTPLAYGIRNWSEFKPARARARDAAKMAPPPITAFNRRLVLALVLSAGILPFFAWRFLLKNSQQKKRSTLTIN